MRNGYATPPWTMSRLYWGHSAPAGRRRPAVYADQLSLIHLPYHHPPAVL